MINVEVCTRGVLYKRRLTLVCFMVSWLSLTWTGCRGVEWARQ